MKIIKSFRICFNLSPILFMYPLFVMFHPGGLIKWTAFLFIHNWVLIGSTRSINLKPIINYFHFVLLSLSSSFVSGFNGIMFVLCDSTKINLYRVLSLFLLLPYVSPSLSQSLLFKDAIEFYILLDVSMEWRIAQHAIKS